MKNIGRNKFDNKIIDIHLHIGGMGNSSPCRMSKKFLSSPAYLYMVLRSRIPVDKLFKDHDKILRKTLIDRLNKSPSVDYGVFLSLDAVHKENGKADKKRSHMVVPNDYVMGISKDNEKVLFGASVHPNRGIGNGTEELDRCIDGGAVLVKWIPNCQIIDPSDKKYAWFYKKLADENLPLLCHTGPEHAIPVVSRKYQEYGNPRKLRLALDMGVTVIAAHCASSFFPWEKSYVDELSEMFEESERGKWHLYADISAMCSLFRAPMIETILKKIPHEHMVFGSDYPVPIDNMSPHLVQTLDVKEYRKISKIDNPIEKNYHQLLAMGFPKEAMTKASSILRF